MSYNVGGGGICMGKIQCNNCAKEIKSMNGILLEDIFERRKDWGYFSKKDLQRDTFYLCEECYDNMIRKFKIPIERKLKNEVL